MTALDWLLSIIGLVGFITFVGIIASFVPSPDLVIVISITVALAAYDFWIRPFVKRG